MEKRGHNRRSYGQKIRANKRQRVSSNGHRQHAMRETRHIRRARNRATVLLFFHQILPLAYYFAHVKRFFFRRLTSQRLWLCKYLPNLFFLLFYSLFLYKFLNFHNLFIFLLFIANSFRYCDTILHFLRLCVKHVEKKKVAKNRENNSSHCLTWPLLFCTRETASVAPVGNSCISLNAILVCFYV